MIKNELKFLLKHTSIYGLGTVVGQAVSFLLLPLYTRYLTPADYGIMALVNATMGLIGVVVGLGINNAMSRFYFDFDDPKDRNKVISTVYIITFFIAIFFSPLFYLSSNILSSLLFHSDKYNLLFFIASISLLLGMIVNVCVDYMRIIAASTKYVIISFVRMFLIIGLNIWFIVILKTGVIGIFYSSLIGVSIFVIVLSIDLLKKIGIGFSFKLAREMISYSFPLIFSNIFRVIVNESDKYFINYFFSPFETGIFSLAQKIGISLHTLVTSPFLQTYLPRRFEIMNQEDAKHTYAKVSLYFFLGISTIGLVLSVFSPEIIQIMTVSDYYTASKYIPFIICSVIIFGMKYHFQIGIMIKKQTKLIAYINGISSAVNIILNCFLIERFGIWGAVITVNISYAIITILDYFWSQKIYRIDYDFRQMAKILCLTSITYFLSTLVIMDSIVESILIKTGIVALYFCSLFFTGIIDRREAMPFLVLFRDKFKIPVKN